MTKIPSPAQFDRALKKALLAFDSARLSRDSMMDDDPDSADNGETAIADFLRERLDPADFTACMKGLDALVKDGGDEAVRAALGTAAGETGQGELDGDRKAAARDRLKVPRLSADAAPSRHATASFAQRFPASVRPKFSL